VTTSQFCSDRGAPGFGSERTEYATVTHQKVTAPDFIEIMIARPHESGLGLCATVCELRRSVGR
jgi:hypothetical protein